MPDESIKAVYDYWVMLNRLHYLLKLIRERNLKPIGLSITKMQILNSLYKIRHSKEEATPILLAKRLFKAPSTITERLNRLESDGLIRRTAPPNNGKEVHIELTEAGLEAISKSRKMNTVRKIISKLSEKQLQDQIAAFEFLIRSARMENELESQLV